MTTTCSLDGCDAPRFAREWCQKHYNRWLRNGSTDPGRYARGDAETRFWAKVNKTDGCWLWTGGTVKGYGKLWTGVDGPRETLAHRFSYELHNGPIPDGAVLDHLCRMPTCVRPDHLEPTDNYTNVVTRGQGLFARRAKADGCHKGHPWTPENTYIRKDTGHRVCRACAAERRRQRAEG